jgi:hypothetical protein
MESKLYASHGINWMWYLRVTHHDDKTVTVDVHDRVRKDDPQPADAVYGNGYRGWKFVESNDGFATHVIIGKDTYPLRNPGYVFGFGSFTGK